MRPSYGLFCSPNALVAIPCVHLPSAMCISFPSSTHSCAQVSTIVGVAWLVSFFLVRIAPMPWLIYEYVRLHYEVSLMHDQRNHKPRDAFAPMASSVHASASEGRGIDRVCSLGMQGAGLLSFEWAISLVTVPVPFILNSYWFVLMTKKAMRLLSGWA